MLKVATSEDRGDGEHRFGKASVEPRFDQTLLKVLILRLKGRLLKEQQPKPKHLGL